MQLTTEDIARFESKYTRGNAEECWEFPGTFSLRRPGVKRKTHTPARISWSISHRQEIPLGKMICHHCDNPPCVNPSHIYLGTGFDNNTDTVKRGRARRALGESCPWSKLTEEQVKEIRVSADSQKSLAERFKVSPSHISRLKTGDRNLWHHVD